MERLIECKCGAVKGQLHTDVCPFPLYHMQDVGHYDAASAIWEQAQIRKYGSPLVQSSGWGLTGEHEFFEWDESVYMFCPDGSFAGYMCEAENMAAMHLTPKAEVPSV